MVRLNLVNIFINIKKLDKEVEILDEPKQVESPKETKYEFRGKCFSCNEIGHMKRDCKNKSFNHVKDFNCHNCHGIGHKAIYCRKTKYDNDRRNSRMSRNTNPADRRRSNERTSRRSYEDRRQIVYYKCNNLGHIARSCHALDDQ